MEPLALAKSLLLAVPLAFLIGRYLPLPGIWRLLAALAGGWLLALALGALLPTGLASYLVSFVIMAMIYAVISLGLNVQWGYAGLFNIGIAAFFAVGAFTSALFTTAMPTGLMASFSHQAFGLGAPFLVGVLAAGLVCSVLAYLVGVPTLRLRGDYLAIATIGIAELTRLVFQNERWLANGPQPLGNIPQPLSCLVNGGCGWLPGVLNDIFDPLGPRDYIFVYLVVVTLVLVIVYLLLERMLHSPWGRVLRAVREEEESAAMNGKNVAAFRMQAFVVGAAVMGIGGALYAHYMVAIDYGHFNPLYATFLIWVMLMLGGSGNSAGAILGAFVIWGVWSGTDFLAGALEPILGAISPELPRRAPYVRYIFIAVLLELILLYRPQGLLREKKVVSKYASASAPQAEPPAPSAAQEA